jgi:hypothetical protein
MIDSLPEFSMGLFLVIAKVCDLLVKAIFQARHILSEILPPGEKHIE